MQATSLIYMSILAMLLVGLFVFIVGGMASAYPTTALNTSQIQQYQNFSAQLNSINTKINQSTIEANSLTQQDNSLLAAFGYLWSAFNSAFTLFALLPVWILNTINVLFSMLQLPTFTGGGISNLLGSVAIVLVSLTTLLGMLYYWLKVQ